jgi:hypothetical protein
MEAKRIVVVMENGSSTVSGGRTNGTFDGFKSLRLRLISKKFTLDRYLGFWTGLTP